MLNEQNAREWLKKWRPVNFRNSTSRFNKIPIIRVRDEDLNELIRFIGENIDLAYNEGREDMRIEALELIEKQNDSKQ